MQMEMLILTSMVAALNAGKAILDVYRTDFTVQHKADKSPLTLADQNSHNIISRHLRGTGIPMLSEEGRQIPFSQRKEWDLLWIVDPLDGTKEFVKKNGEFTVNIALVQSGRPILGIIYIPDPQIMYFAHTDIGAFKLENPQIFSELESWPTHDNTETYLNQIMQAAQKLPFVAPQTRTYTIVGSRSHATPELESFVAQKREQYPDLEFISAGSSLKLCLVAENRADIYPRLGPTMEWDTAAGQAIVECAGGKVLVHESLKPLAYNREDLLNPWFIVLSSTSV